MGQETHRGRRAADGVTSEPNEDCMDVSASGLGVSWVGMVATVLVTGSGLASMVD